MQTLLPLAGERTRYIFTEQASLRWVFTVSVADLISSEYGGAAQGKATDAEHGVEVGPTLAL